MSAELRKATVGRLRKEVIGLDRGAGSGATLGRNFKDKVSLTFFKYLPCFQKRILGGQIQGQDQRLRAL